MSDEPRSAGPEADAPEPAEPVQAAEAEPEEDAAASEPPTEAIAVAPTAEELAELRRKAAEYDDLMDRLKRVTADYINSQKRLERQMEERTAFAIEGFARELLPVADNLARAAAAAAERGMDPKILRGIELVEKKLYAVLMRHGIEPVHTQIGDPFDSSVHEAVSVVESREYEPNRVVRELQKGFRLHGRLLRAAHVLVSAKPKEEGAKQSETHDKTDKADSSSNIQE